MDIFVRLALIPVTDGGKGSQRNGDSADELHIEFLAIGRGC